MAPGRQRRAKEAGHAGMAPAAHRLPPPLPTMVVKSEWSESEVKWSEVKWSLFGSLKILDLLYVIGGVLT